MITPSSQAPGELSRDLQTALLQYALLLCCSVAIRNPLTISKLRAMNPRNLKSHIERALEQSQNEHIAHVKIMSSNQLKSGDLSLRTATTPETKVLRQFADDRVCRVGNGANIRNPTYGVLAHGIRTNTMEMDNFEEIWAEMSICES